MLTHLTFPYDRRIGPTRTLKRCTPGISQAMGSDARATLPRYRHHGQKCTGERAPPYRLVEEGPCEKEPHQRNHEHQHAKAADVFTLNEPVPGPDRRGGSEDRQER